MILGLYALGLFTIEIFLIELFKIKYDLAPLVMDSMLSRGAILLQLQKFARVSVGKKENCVLWFSNN